MAWEDVVPPAVGADTDAIVRVDTTTICGTDLHILRGDLPAMVDGQIIGHEAVGTVVETGAAVKNLRPGDRVLVSCVSASAKAWIHGGSPTKGFLGSATKGPFTGFYHSLAGTTFADVFFMIALAAIGRRTPRGSRGSGTEASTSTRASPWAARTASASNAASPGLSTPLPAARETGMRDWTGNGASRRLVI